MIFSRGAYFPQRGGNGGFLCAHRQCAGKEPSLLQGKGESRAGLTPWQQQNLGSSHLLSTVRKIKTTGAFFSPDSSIPTKNIKLMHKKIENDEKVNCEAATIKVVSPATVQMSEHERRDYSRRLQEAGGCSSMKSSRARRRLHNQLSFSKSYFEISCFWPLDILKTSPGLSL